MRSFALSAVVAASLAVGLSGCWDGAPNPFAQKAPKPAAPAASAAQVATPAPSGVAIPATPAETAAQPAAASMPAPVAAAAPAAPAAPQVVRWTPADWPRQERRLAALVANAETRDTIGETHRVVAEADARRRSCTTRACIERAYADEERWLRQWEGSGDVR